LRHCGKVLRERPIGEAQMLLCNLSEATKKIPRKTPIHRDWRFRFQASQSLCLVDLDVRVGDEIAPYYIPPKLATNHRVLCALPS
jgi:hypothetical protein